jgi:hypothetical protein
MASLSDSVKALEEYLAKSSSDAAKLFSSAKLSEKTDPLGIAKNSIQTTSLDNVRAKLATNPLVQMGTDTLNQMATPVVQSLVSQALSKVNLSPIQNAVQNFFQAWATISTFEVEVAMELARNTARNILKELDAKDALLKDIQAQLVAIHNACAIILNSSPFLDGYIKQLIQAYTLMTNADRKFKDVVRVLQVRHRYQTLEFTSAMTDLQSAQALILPDRGVNVSSIQAVKDYASATIKRQTNKDALAAALVIPGLTLKLGTTLLSYVKSVTNINLLLNTYADALDGWIASFKRNDNIDQVAIDHINAGISQLDDLLASMKSQLYPDIDRYPDLNPAGAGYGTKLTSQATGWGIKLQAIIEWMRLNPKKGLETLDKTSNSVSSYLRSKTAIENMGNLSYTGGTFNCTQGREDVETGVRAITRLMLRVNTITATQQTKVQITAEFRAVGAYFTTSATHSTRLRSAISQFLSTTSSLQGPARQIIGQAYGIANKYGLDRVAGLISDGKIRELFNVTPDTATYAGSAVVGMNQVLSLVKAQPNATDAQVSKIENLRDNVERDKKAKEIEANRSYASTVDAAQDELVAKLKQIKSSILPAVEAAQQLDSTNATTPASKADADVSNAIAGFNTNRAQAGLQS